MNNCVIYARFSSYGQNEQSIEAQTRICKEFAENKGLNVIKLYSDKARTGTNDDRPGFQKMIHDAASKSFQYIIVYMFDRFARNRRDSIMYKETLREKYGIKVISALEPIADDEGGEFYEMFLEWNAEKYSKRLSKRVKDGLDTSCANGTFCGGHLLYEYSLVNEPIPNRPNKFIKKVVINEEEASLVKYVFEQYDKGVTKKELAEEFNRKGYLYRGKPFTQKPMEHWLKNQKYTGEFMFGERFCDNMYPPIISKELYERVQKRLEKNQYRLGGQSKANVPYLLSGKAYCGHCGELMCADGGKSKTGHCYLYYTCKNRKKHTCNKKREEKECLEYFITSLIIQFISNDKNAEIIVNDCIKYADTKTSQKNIKSITTKISNTKKKIADLTNAFVLAQNDLIRSNIEMQVDEYGKMLDDLELQKNKLELERGCIPTKEDLLAFIKVIINGDSYNKEFQRTLIDNLVYKVIVTDGAVMIILNLNKNIILEDYSKDQIIKFGNGLKDIKAFGIEPPSSRQEKLRLNSGLDATFFISNFVVILICFMIS